MPENASHGLGIGARLCQWQCAHMERSSQKGPRQGRLKGSRSFRLCSIMFQMHNIKLFYVFFMEFVRDNKEWNSNKPCFRWRKPEDHLYNQCKGNPVDGENIAGLCEWPKKTWIGEDLCVVQLRHGRCAICRKNGVYCEYHHSVGSFEPTELHCSGPTPQPIGRLEGTDDEAPLSNYRVIVIAKCIVFVSCLFKSFQPCTNMKRKNSRVIAITKNSSIYYVDLSS